MYGCVFNGDIGVVESVLVVSVDMVILIRFGKREEVQRVIFLEE